MGKNTFGKVAILPTRTCLAVTSKQGRLAGMPTDPQTRRTVDSCAAAERATQMRLHAPRQRRRQATGLQSEWRFHKVIKTLAEKQLGCPPV